MHPALQADKVDVHGGEPVLSDFEYHFHHTNAL